MNPAAKEFVPAHILRKRQEEADRLGEQLDKVNISSTSNNNKTENRESCSGDQKAKTTNEVQDVENSSTTNLNKQNNSNQNSTNPTEQADNNKSNNEVQYNGTNNHHINDNNHESEYPEGLQQLIEDDDDDRYLLNAGENLCEFNGEQFIIPGDDDEYDESAPINAGYDFGNAEDNEDEDVCNAFEEFLENLPDQ